MQGQGADETIIGIYEHCSDLSVDKSNKEV